MFGAFRAAPGRQEGPRHVNFTDLRILGACGAEGEGQTRTTKSSYRRVTLTVLEGGRITGGLSQ